MAEETELKIKGAAARASEKAAGQPPSEPSEEPEPQPAAQAATPPPTSVVEDGEVSDKGSNLSKPKDGENGEALPQTSSSGEDLRRYRWCKCLCDPAQYGGTHYFLNLDTQESRWDEPSEPYWLWNAETQALDPVGLLHPSTATSNLATNSSTAGAVPAEEYTGYNPKIHGSYDPNASYAQYHNKKREEETLIAQGYDPAAIQQQQHLSQASSDYTAAGTFNRFTGAFQDSTKSADRHTDAAKSSRQLNAYFDVDAAANMHDGRSLKEERRNEKLSKKQIKELADKRRAKKEKKRMDFYKS